jgi:transketolase
MMNIPVTAVGVGSGISYDDSGPTHHATEDVAIMRALPNMTVLNTSDSIMAGRFAEMTCDISGPHYVRLDILDCAGVYGEEIPREIFCPGLPQSRDTENQ